METSSSKKPITPIVTIGGPDNEISRRRASRWPVALTLGVSLGVGFLLIGLPGSLRDKLVLLNTGLCPQRAGHSYFFENRQMPLEARMVGIFAGFLLTLIGLWLVGRGRALQWPRRNLTLLLASMIGWMALDGLNSTFQDLGWPTLYEPQNWLRLLTGAVSGVGMAGLILPALNLVVWRRGYLTPTFKRTWEIGLALIPALLYVGATLSGAGWLYWPLSWLAVIGVITMLVIFNLLIVTILLRRENQASNLVDFLALATPVFVISLSQMILFAVFRIALTGVPASL